MTSPAIPVAIDLQDRDLAHEVGRHVERSLGWQVVHDTAALPARLVLADAVVAGRPTVVVSRSGSPDALRASLRAGALDHVRWPDDAGRLESLRLPDGSDRVGAELVIGVAGAAAGVGASCVALLLGGALAWSGRDTLVLGGSALRRLSGIAATDTAVESVRGVTRLRVGHSSVTSGHVGSVDAIVVDLGITRAGSVLVGRADGALVAAVRRPRPWACVVTSGDGVLHPAELSAALHGMPHIHIPRSFRLGRAALEGRVPVGAPGWSVTLAGEVLTTVAGTHGRARRRRRRRTGAAA